MIKGYCFDRPLGPLVCRKALCAQLLELWTWGLWNSPVGSLPKRSLGRMPGIGNPCRMGSGVPWNSNDPAMHFDKAIQCSFAARFSGEKAKLSRKTKGTRGETWRPRKHLAGHLFLRRISSCARFKAESSQLLSSCPEWSTLTAGPSLFKGPNRLWDCSVAVNLTAPHSFWRNVANQ